jgi:hypothetical protein
MEERLLVKDFIHNIKEFTTLLVVAGEPISSKMIVNLMLNDFPPSYENLVVCEDFWTSCIANLLEKD